jgi:coenzyme F420-reducing hydrogenase beta subunit
VSNGPIIIGGDPYGVAVRLYASRVDAVRLEPHEAPRQCGACTLCCKVMEVTDLQKPRGQWCRHAAAKKGCAVHGTDAQPEACRTFRCLWLDGLVREPLSPRRIHGFLTATTDGENVVIHEDPGWPGAASQWLSDYIERFIADGVHYVVVACGESRRLIARPDRLAELAKRMEVEDGL